MLAAGLSVNAPAPVLLDQRQLNAISSRCGTPKSWLQRRGKRVRLGPMRNAKYEQVDCLLAALRKMHAGSLGFVGNEAYKP